jgi:hypothetical protein
MTPERSTTIVRALFAPPRLLGRGAGETPGAVKSVKVVEYEDGRHATITEREPNAVAAVTPMPTMAGHFAVFNTWTEINSNFEGNFLERIAPGAFGKTFVENRNSIRVLFQHGRDPVVGDKPLGPIITLREDARGAAYEVTLLDTTYNRDLLPALEAGLYGASFRFAVMQEEHRKSPGASDYNPKGLPERTIRAARVFEFGPVTFPAYAGATAGVRSMTDWYRST